MSKPVNDKDITESLDANNTDVFLMVSDSHNADMYYVSQFSASDPFTYLQTKDGDEVLFLSEMERGRAEIESRVSDVRTTSEYGYRTKVKEKPDAFIAYCDCLADMLQDLGVRRISAPRNFPLYIAQYLKEVGFSVQPVKSPYRDMRAVKNADEIEKIRNVQKAGEEGMKCAVDLIKASEEIDGILYYEGSELTSDRVRAAIEHRLLDSGCHTMGTIVSCGKHSAIPHHMGEGALLAGQPIVIDIFPQSKKTMYYADMCRTVLKGEPSGGLTEMYDAVIAAQQAALEMIRPGVLCRDIHSRVCEIFEERGFDTYLSGSKSGFIHSTGHGVGLDVHEWPMVGDGEGKLEEGNVITIEPGLYYPHTGGVRIEDIVVVTAKGYENLTDFEKRLVL